MDEKKLFWQIFRAKDEDELHEIINNNEFLFDNNNWFPYGGETVNDRGNFGTFENQQANPIPALVEKITNSIDTLLLKHCRINGIDPTSDKAPQKMADAVENFFGIRNGDFSEISQKDRRNIAEDIQIIAEGNRQTPNLIFYDNGEGQHPDQFKNTFLSLARNNKIDIKFVHGIYNMGSTGAVIFCGEHRYQLIASKRNQQLSEHVSNKFGYTLVRMHPLSEDEENHLKSSWYEYLIVDGKIPQFEIDELDLGLYKRKFKTGSIVKLYSYGLPRGSRSLVTFDLWRDLNQYLYHPALPFIVYEKRYDIEKQKTPSKPILGNKIRLTLDEREKKEKTLTISTSNNLFGEIFIEIHVLKPNVDHKEFINKKSVVFTYNGQVQASLPRTFITQELGYSLLRDSLLIQIDCTKMKTSFRQCLFKGSRDRINEGRKTEQFKEKIIELLKGNDELKFLNQNRKNRILRESTEDKSLLSKVMSCLPVNEEIINLFKNNNEFQFFKKEGNIKRKIRIDNEKKQKYPMKRFPSIFKIKLKDKGDGKLIKSIPLNGKGTVNFETDVEDEYLFRPREKGELELEILGYNKNESSGGTDALPNKIEEVFNITKTGPTDQSIRITFEPKDNLSVGEEIKLNARLSSPDGDIESIFWVRITTPQEEKQKKKLNEKENQISPPIPIRVFKKIEKEKDKTWEDYNWTGNDIVKVITDNTNKHSIIEAIAVNMDSHVFRRFLSRNKIVAEEKLKFIKNKYFISIYLHSLFLYSILNKLNKEDEVEIDPDEAIPEIFKLYSGFLLSSFLLDN